MRNTYDRNAKCTNEPWLMILKMFITNLILTLVLRAVYESIILLRITPWNISVSHTSSLGGGSRGLHPATLFSFSILRYLALTSGKFSCSGDSPCPFAEVVSVWVLERWWCRQDGVNSDGRQPVPSSTTAWEECRISIPFPLDRVFPPEKCLFASREISSKKLLFWNFVLDLHSFRPYSLSVLRMVY